MANKDLSAELRNARALPGPEPIVQVEFALKNRSSKPIVLMRRWNSDGAFQWTIELTDARGTKYLMTNPMSMWSANFPESFTIDPGAEQVILCKLLWGKLSGADGMSNAAREMSNSPKIFQCRSGSGRPGEPWRYPISLTGRFTARYARWQAIRPGKRGNETYWRETNWVGSITTKPLRLNGSGRPA